MSQVPEHIAIIMDGNGRWAKQKGILRAKGHEDGGRSVQRALDLCREHGVKWLTLYAFSTENWGRSALEVNALMHLLDKYLKERTPEMMEKNVRLHAIGELHMLPENCRRQLQASIEATRNNTGVNLVLALSYGSRQEITAAVRHLAEQVKAGSLQPEDITPETIATHLYTAGMPDPDLLIRTGGEVRLSNYLLWQCAYSELYFCDTFWPDFKEEELRKAICDYQKRERRFGKTSEQI